VLFYLKIGNFKRSLNFIFSEVFCYSKNESKHEKTGRSGLISKKEAMYDKKNPRKRAEILAFFRGFNYPFNENI